VWKEPYVQTTIRITDKRMRWLEKAALKDRRLTPTFLVNVAIDQLMAKEAEDRDPSPEEVATYLKEKREAETEIQRIAGPK
jgi:hypothetical protein